MRRKSLWNGVKILKNGEGKKQEKKEGTDMKKIVSIIIGLVLMLTLVSCQNEKKAVENDVKETMGALQKGNFSALKADKQTENVFKAFEGAYKKMSYKINNTTEKNKDKILVNITMKYPDLSETAEMFKNRISKEAQSLSGKSEEEFNKQSMAILKEVVNEKLNDSNLKYFEETFDITYIKQGDSWEIEENNPQFIKAVSFNFPI